MRLKRVLLAVMLSALILTSVGVPFQVRAQTATPPDIRQLFDSMTSRRTRRSIVSGHIHGHRYEPTIPDL